MEYLSNCEKCIYFNECSISGYSEIIKNSFQKCKDYTENNFK